MLSQKKILYELEKIRFEVTYWRTYNFYKINEELVFNEILCARNNFKNCYKQNDEYTNFTLAFEIRNKLNSIINSLAVRWDLEWFLTDIWTSLRFNSRLDFDKTTKSSTALCKMMHYVLDINNHNSIKNYCSGISFKKTLAENYSLDEREIKNSPDKNSTNAFDKNITDSSFDSVVDKNSTDSIFDKKPVNKRFVQENIFNKKDVNNFYEENYVKKNIDQVVCYLNDEEKKLFNAKDMEDMKNSFIPERVFNRYYPRAIYIKWCDASISRGKTLMSQENKLYQKRLMRLPPYSVKLPLHSNNNEKIIELLIKQKYEDDGECILFHYPKILSIVEEKKIFDLIRKFRQKDLSYGNKLEKTIQYFSSFPFMNTFYIRADKYYSEKSLENGSYKIYFAQKDKEQKKNDNHFAQNNNLFSKNIENHFAQNNNLFSKNIDSTFSGNNSNDIFSKNTDNHLFSKNNSSIFPKNIDSHFSKNVDNHFLQNSNSIFPKNISGHFAQNSNSTFPKNIDSNSTFSKNIDSNSTFPKNVDNIFTKNRNDLIQKDSEVYLLKKASGSLYKFSEPPNLFAKSIYDKTDIHQSISDHNPFTQNIAQQKSVFVSKKRILFYMGKVLVNGLFNKPMTFGRSFNVLFGSLSPDLQERVQKIVYNDIDKAEYDLKVLAKEWGLEHEYRSRTIQFILNQKIR